MGWDCRTNIQFETRMIGLKILQQSIPIWPSVEETYANQAKLDCILDLDFIAANITCTARPRTFLTKEALLESLGDDDPDDIEEPSEAARWVVKLSHSGDSQDVRPWRKCDNFPSRPPLAPTQSWFIQEKVQSLVTGGEARVFAHQSGIVGRKFCSRRDDAGLLNNKPDWSVWLMDQMPDLEATRKL